MAPTRTRFPKNLSEIAQRAAELKTWAAENPELANAWNAAWEEDEVRAKARDAKEKDDARRRYVLERTPSRLVALGAPPRAVEQWRSGESQPNAAVAALERMEAERRGFALLTGDTGVGKTCAAVALMARRLLLDERDELPALFVRATEGARMGLYDADDKKLAAQMRAATLLVLDDLGAEFLSDGSIWRTILDEVIDSRYGDNLPTVLTTNLTLEPFKARYGARIADRIRHAGIIETCGAGSLRARGEG